jgi:hypothetical protein
LQAFGQIGDSCPDIDDISLLKNAFNTVQHLIDEGLLSAGHDVSDGGVVTTLLEMAFAGNCGLQVWEPRFFVLSLTWPGIISLERPDVHCAAAGGPSRVAWSRRVRHTVRRREWTDPGGTFLLKTRISHDQMLTACLRACAQGAAACTATRLD